MPQEQISFNSSKNLNVSLQKGDKVYWQSFIDGILVGDPEFAGTLYKKINSKIVLTVGVLGLIPIGSFILFEKSIKANEAGSRGYYADVTFTNNSKTRAELFAVSSEVIPSSK